MLNKNERNKMKNAEFSERAINLFNKNFVVNVAKMLSRVIIFITIVLLSDSTFVVDVVIKNFICLR